MFDANFESLSNVKTIYDKCMKFLRELNEIDFSEKKLKHGLEKMQCIARGRAATRLRGPDRSAIPCCSYLTYCQRSNIWLAENR
jgi:hypothetical protein